MGTRKLTLDERRHEALRLRAKALRISEDELVQRAIDAVLAETSVMPSPPDHPYEASEHLEAARDVFDLVASLGPGLRAKDDIDQQVAEERAAWEDR